MNSPSIEIPSSSSNAYVIALTDFNFEEISSVKPASSFNSFFAHSVKFKPAVNPPAV